ncbi:MAG TPA: hypothetical protein PLY34_09105 [Ferruginibacter sp.]|nr:hypothetical protein [Ferruginibacter sp.]
MTTKILSLLVTLVFSLPLFSQVAISSDGSAPHPSAMLEIKSTNKGLLVPRSSSSSIILMPAAQNGLVMYDTTFEKFRIRASNAWYDIVDSRSWTRSLTTARQVVYTTDSVGIGTTNPTAKLHVNSGISGELIRLGSNDPMIGFYQSSTLTGFADISGSDFRMGTVASNDAGKAIIRVNGGDRLTVAPDGNVGIANNTPVSQLHILGGTDAGLTSNNNGYLMLGSAASGNLIFDNNEIQARNVVAGSDLFIQNDGGNVILCGAEQGGVGIGVTSGASIPAGYLLAVDGKVLTEEVRVELSGDWPDYVFENDYQLTPFDKLRNFIAENKHLPNIPAAAEVEKNGFELGDMQKRMVEKIEELTLYVLQLESDMKEMKEKLDELKKQKN